MHVTLSHQVVERAFRGEAVEVYEAVERRVQEIVRRKYPPQFGGKSSDPMEVRLAADPAAKERSRLEREAIRLVLSTVLREFANRSFNSGPDARAIWLEARRHPRSGVPGLRVLSFELDADVFATILGRTNLYVPAWQRRRCGLPELLVIQYALTDLGPDRATEAVDQIAAQIPQLREVIECTPDSRRRSSSSSA